MVRFPEGFRCETLRKDHPRAGFDSGAPAVDAWLAKRALRSQEKRLSVTHALVDADGAIAGYFTLATGQVDFGALPSEIAKRLPHRAVPVAILARLGVDRRHQGTLTTGVVDCG